jgi:hypothetical protein
MGHKVLGERGLFLLHDFAAAIQEDLGELSRVGKGEWFLGVADI